MRSRSLALLAVLASGCLPMFAPDMRARGIHAGLGHNSPRSTCMGCHMTEGEAIERKLTTPSEAPLVADWMLTERRSCVNCHRMHEPRARERASVRLPSLSEVPRGT